MKIFKVIGKMKKLKSSQKFTVESMGKTEEDALERVYSILGSRHHISRKYILIDEVQPLSKEDVTDPYILFELKKVE